MKRKGIEYMNTKKILTGLLCSAFVLGITTGCTVKASKPTQTNATQQTEDHGQDRAIYGTYAIPDVARNNQVEMEVDSVEIVRWEQMDVFDRVTKTHDYIKAHVVITNLSEEDLDLQPKSIRGYIDNEQLTVSNNNQAYEALGISGNVIEQVTIHPGRSEKGYVLYEYYRSWDEFEIQYKDSSLDFGIRFDENDVVVRRTSSDPNVTYPDETTETKETSSGPNVSIPGVSNPTQGSSNQTNNTTSDTPVVTIPGAGDTTVITTEPSTAPGGDMPSVTIPAPGGG